ncbi:MAG: ABC transporter ATP-binding protein [Acidimicrobiia bacterium]|nr:ABC transporter ATP-binding protein [Acidimicrobiia bacterium]
MGTLTQAAHGQNPAIEVSGLTKRYGELTAVDGISLRVDRGEVFALLGPNGAGKTTTVEILEGYRQADAGTVTVLGRDPGEAGQEWKDRIGIVLQQSGIETELTVREALTRLARIYSRPADVDGTIDQVGLADKADSRIKVLSGGQRRRVDMAAAIIGNPELIFLDEPTTGFDPAARRDAWRLITELAQGGTTVLLTTHYLDEARHLADRVAVIRAGKIVAEGDPATLGGREQRRAVIRFRHRGPLPSGLGGEIVVATDGWIEIATDAPTADLAILTGWAQGELEGLEVSRPTLEDVYLELAGEADE